MNRYREMFENLHRTYLQDSAIAVAARDAAYLLRVRRHFVDAIDRFISRDYDYAMRHFDALDQIPATPMRYAVYWLLAIMLLCIFLVT